MRMSFNDRIRQLEDFFENITEEKFNNMLQKAGFNQIKDLCDNRGEFSPLYDEGFEEIA